MGTISATLRKLGHQAWFARLGRALTPVDRWLGRLTRGRFVAFSLREMPSLLITTTGRRSGQPRRNPLLYAPDGDSFVVVGSNWGQRDHPAWTVNLLANPAATISVSGTDIPVTARLIHGAERDRALRLLRTVWPAYQTYADRAAHRELRVFRLEPDRVVR